MMTDSDGEHSDIAPTLIDSGSGSEAVDDIVSVQTDDDEDLDGEDDFADDVRDEYFVGEGVYVDSFGIDDFTLNQIVRDDPAIRVALLQNLPLTCPNILQHCKRQIDMVRVEFGGTVCIFKIGITAAPVNRFKYYHMENYETIVLIHISVSYNLINMLEATLIQTYMGPGTGCRNIHLGGEGNLHRALPPYYAYVVTARADGRLRIG